MPNWNPPKWTPYNYKHRPRARLAWKKIVARTLHSEAKYIPGMTDNDHEALEMKCVHEGHLGGDNGSIRWFYLDTGQLIGASEGKETTIVYAEWNRLGDLHGSPITKEELKKLGVQI